MIALNLLEQDLGIDPIDNNKKLDLDEILESIVGKDNIKELNDEVGVLLFGGLWSGSLGIMTIYNYHLTKLRYPAPLLACKRARSAIIVLLS